MTHWQPFDATPWARGALNRDPERRDQLQERAQHALARIGIGGRAAGGPWTVQIGSGARVLRFRGPVLFELLEFGLARWEAGADDAGHEWIAGAGGIAHAQQKRRARTACGLPQTDARYRHPEDSRCRGCWIALDRTVVAA